MNPTFDFQEFKDSPSSCLVSLPNKAVEIEHKASSEFDPSLKWPRWSEVGWMKK
jgi:hypothetical protein